MQEIKAANAALISHEAYSGIANVHCFPSTILLSPSQKCNFRCRTCMQTHDKTELPPETLKKVEALMPFASVLDFVGGEPLLLESFRRAIGWGSKYACRMETVTNGLLLDDVWRERFVESLGSVRISVDGATQKTYQYVRRHPDLLTVLKNIGELALLRLRRGRETPLIEINFVAMRANIRELPRLVALAGELGVDAVRVIFMLAHTEELAKQSLYFMQEESDACMRLAVEVGTRAGVNVQIPGYFSEAPAADRPKRRHKCSGPWHFLGVDADGSAKICCGGAPSFGNLNTQTFQEFWQGAALRHLRRTINTPDEPEYCKNCFHGGDNLRRVSKHIIRPGLAEAAAAALGVALPPQPDGS
uniref:Putative Fe-S oxidoreductase n=1 Tax=Desulfovibrio sp. U5L TaxID=596152 RepID=I2Q7J1_9BACT